MALELITPESNTYFLIRRTWQSLNYKPICAIAKDICAYSRECTDNSCLQWRVWETEDG